MSSLGNDHPLYFVEHKHLLDMREPSSMSESSIRDTTSAVSTPFSSSSPLFLKVANERF